MVTNSSAGVVSRHDYMPFGEELGAGVGGRTVGMGFAASDGLRPKFTSYERDAESSLDFAQARYYSSSQGRFTSGDPLMASAVASNPQTFNRYSYVLNSPLNLVDPTGMMSIISGGGCFDPDGGGYGVPMMSTVADDGGEPFEAEEENPSEETPEPEPPQSRGTILIIVGDPGELRNLGSNNDRAAATKKAELEKAGFTVVVVRASTDQQFIDAFKNNGMLRGVEFIGHATASMLGIGGGTGEHTNLTYDEVTMLSNANLTDDAYIKFNACNAGSTTSMFGTDNIAAKMASHLNRTVLAFDGGTIFSGSESRRVTVGKGKDERPPSKGPLYLIGDHGTKLKSFSP